ncbi:hypothetical protein ACLK17_01845 [Escherichia coli]
MHNITEVAIHRLEQQLGKPYDGAARGPIKASTVAGWFCMPTTRS